MWYIHVSLVFLLNYLTLITNLIMTVFGRLRPRAYDDTLSFHTHEGRPPLQKVLVRDTAHFFGDVNKTMI